VHATSLSLKRARRKLRFHGKPYVRCCDEKRKKTGLLAGDIPGLSHSITRGVRYINENHERASYLPLAVTLFIVSRARARERVWHCHARRNIATAIHRVTNADFIS